MKIIGLSLVSILFISCVIPQKGLAQKKSSNNGLMSNGYYNTFDTSTMPCGDKVNLHYKIYSPLIVVNEKNALYGNGADRSNSASTLGFYRNLKGFQETVGTYSLKGNEIVAQLPIYLYLRGMRMKMFIANFSGVIKNKDTIINWRMVSPYPNAPKKFNEDFKDLIEPHVLYFVESKELEGLNDLYQERIKAQVK